MKIISAVVAGVIGFSLVACGGPTVQSKKIVCVNATTKQPVSMDKCDVGGKDNTSNDFIPMYFLLLSNNTVQKVPVSNYQNSTGSNNGSTSEEENSNNNPPAEEEQAPAPAPEEEAPAPVSGEE